MRRRESMDAPPPTSSTAPRSRRVSNSRSSIWMVMSPPSIARVLLPSALRRTPGNGAPTNEPSALAVLTQAPAVDSTASLRTMTRSVTVASSGEIGAVVGMTGCTVSVPPGNRMSPAKSICGARRISSPPTPEVRLTSEGSTMRPLVLSSTRPKAVSTRPCAVCRAVPNTCDAASVNASCCALVSTPDAPNPAPRLSLASCRKVRLPMRWLSGKLPSAGL